MTVPSSTQITFITPTGGRPEAFGLCAKFVARQSLKHWHWIVVDDGAVPITEGPVWPALARNERCTYLRSEPGLMGQISLKRNLELALKSDQSVGSDWIAFLEDDDWYHGEYVERSLRKSPSECTLIGEANARYYHLPSRRYRMMGNRAHASLAQTIMHRSLLPCLLDILESNDDSFDMLLWQAAWRTSKPCLFPESTHSVGIKGMPGRPGIGVGHSPRGPWIDDPQFEKLRDWTGADFDHYIALQS